MLFVIHIGWARPVPINPGNFRNPRRGLLWVSLAGPLANVVLALFCGILLRLTAPAAAGAPVGAAPAVLIAMLAWGMVINLVLAAFNILPLPPLDGSKVLGSLLPRRMAAAAGRYRRWGPMILLLAVVVGRPVIWAYIGPVVRFFGRLFAGGDFAQLLNTL
jgi:Zn-dependent protease